MSRQEDFKRMAHSHDTESSKYEQQFYIDGAEDGYEYAVDKACEWIKKNVLEFEHQSFVHEFNDCVEDFRKAMEE